MNILNSFFIYIILTFTKRIFKESLTRVIHRIRENSYRDYFLPNRSFTRINSTTSSGQKPRQRVKPRIARSWFRAVVQRSTRCTHRNVPSWPKPVLEITRRSGRNNGADEISSEERAGQVCYRSTDGTRISRRGGGALLPLLSAITFFRFESCRLCYLIIGGIVPQQFPTRCSKSRPGIDSFCRGGGQGW